MRPLQLWCGSPRFAPLRFYVLMAALIATSWAAFSPALSNGFIDFDDPDYVTDNPHLRHGVTPAAVHWAFTDTQQVGFWHPVTWLSHLLDAQVFGLNPTGHHLTSLLIHTANVVLLFVAVRRLTGCTWRSCGVAALFGIHPLHVESVAWVAERKDVLSAFFFLWALVTYARYASPARGVQRRAWYLATLTLFIVGLMAKPTIVTLPAVLLLLDYWPLRRVSRNARGCVWEKVPFAVVAAASCVVTFVAQHGAGAVSAGVPFSARIENAVVSYARYLGKLIWPADLAPFYPYPRAWPALAVAAALALVAFLSIATFRLRRRAPYLFVGWAWFVGMLVPAIGLVQVGQQAMADRFSYLPSIGVFVAVIWAAGTILSRYRCGPAIGAGGLAVAVAIGMVVTRRQVRYWRDSATLFRHALEVTTANHVAHFCLGVAWQQAGRLDDAVVEYRAALQVQPSYADAHTNLGYVFARQGRTDAARAEFAAAERLGATPAKIAFGRGLVDAAAHRAREAAAEFETALRGRPGWVEARHNLAMALRDAGDADGARRELGRIAEADGNSATAHFEFGRALLDANRLDDAIAELRAALALDPDRIEARVDLGNALARRGALPEAIDAFRAALSAAPNLPEAHNNLGLALALHGELAAAIVEFKRAIALRPDYATATANLAHATELAARAAPPP